MKIQIPKPCSEDIQKMTPVERGVFCGACQKTVIDFSSMSDTEIIEYFKKAAKQKTCGIFSETQLNRNLKPKKTETKRYKLFFKELAAALVAFFLTSTSAKSQNESTKTEYHQKIEVNPLEDIAPPFVISGKVVNGKEALSEAIVSIKDTDYETTSFRNGAFSLLVSKGSIQKQDSITLIVEHRDFQTKEMVISPKTQQSVLIDFDEKGEILAVEEKKEDIKFKQVSWQQPQKFEYKVEHPVIWAGNIMYQEPFPKKTLWYYVNTLFFPTDKKEHPVNIKEQDSHQPKKSTLMPHVSQWYTRIKLYQNIKDFMKRTFS